MAAIDHLGEQFKSVHQEMMRTPLTSYGKELDLHSPDDCRGNCDLASERLQGLAYAAGVRPVGRMRLANDDPSQDHVVAVHRGHVVDYTLRQFEPDAEVPHVEPVKQYMQRRGYNWAVKD